MIAARRMTALAAGCGTLLLTVTACQDGEAKRRAEVQEIIASATTQIQGSNALLSDPDQVDRARGQLNKVISELADTRDAEPGQRAAAAALAASVHRRLASLTVAEAMAVEADLRSMRTILIGTLDSADQFDGMAAGLEAIDVRAADETLVAAHDQTRDELASASGRMAELDGPIAEMSRANRDDQDKAQLLRNEAAVLRREAAELGAANGYGTFEQAQRLDREADGVELELAHRELDLRYNYEPEHALARTKADRLGDRLTSIDAARQTLHERQATAAGEADATRARLDQISEAIEAGLGELLAAGAALAELYDDAARQLDQAATKAQAAAGLAGKDFADAARIEAAQAYNELGSLYHCRANGIQDQVRLMQRVSEVSGATGAAVDDLHAAQSEQLSKAADAYKSAGGELGRVSGRTARERLETLKMAMSSLETGSVRAPAPAPAPEADRSSARPAADPSGGAQSPEALLAAMLDESHPSPLSLIYFGDVTPQQARLVDGFKAAEAVELAMVAALRERFDLDAAEGSMLAMMASRDLTLNAVDGDRGTMTRTMMGSPVPVEIVRVDGLWYVDGTAALDEMSEQASGMGQDPARFLGAVTDIMRDLTGRITADEFGSLQDVDMAFITALQASLAPGG